MKKWLVLFAVILLIVIWQIFSIFLTIQQEKTQGLEEKRELAEELTGLEVKSYQRYHGSDLYFVFTAKDTRNKQYYIFVNNERQVRKLALDRIRFSQAAAKKKAVTEFNEINDILRIVPAFSSERFTWEIVALDQKNKLYYLYYDMLDGSFQKKLN